MKLIQWSHANVPVFFWGGVFLKQAEKKHAPLFAESSLILLSYLEPAQGAYELLASRTHACTYHFAT